jgi:regulator of sirC expression with transglutaminase-like and TPR domain
MPDAAESEQDLHFFSIVAVAALCYIGDMPSAPVELRPLLRLLDDDTPVVREAVRQKLAAIRHELPEHFLALGESLDEERQRLISEILAPICREELESSWMSWRWLSSPEAQLEEALGQISAFLSGWQTKAEELPLQLDALAERAVREGGTYDPHKLADFLFGGRGDDARLRGNTKDYYAAQNSNLLWVLANGQGNPISLSCIYMLLGRRLGMRIEGCNFPGHFLARVRHESKVWLVDCFNRGRFMLSEDVAKHHPAANPSMEDVVRDPAPVEAIIARVLRNLDEAFERESNLTQRHVIRRLMLKLMDA